MLTKHALKTELDSDPLARGYAGMTDAQVAADLNTVYRQINRETVSGSQIYEAVNETEFQALAAEQKVIIREIYTLGDSIPVQAGRMKANIIAVFGVGTTTRANLVTLSKIDVSRAQELGWRPVREGDVAQARALA